jgi:hypothetical protein
VSRLFNRAFNQGLCTDPLETTAGDGVHPSVDLNTQNLTFACWHYKTTSGGSFQRVAEVGAFATPQGGFAVLDRGPFSGGIQGAVYAANSNNWSGGFGQTPGLALNNWYHYCVTGTNVISLFYVDGALRGSTGYLGRASGFADVTVAAEMLGTSGQPGGKQFGNGRVCELAIWGAQLVPADVARLALGVSQLRLQAVLLPAECWLRSGRNLSRQVGAAWAPPP